jgi:hypothetical protein
LIYDIKRRLQECHEIARNNLIRTKQNRVEDQKNKVYMPVFQEGDTALLNIEKAGKLDPLWLGFYKV